MIPPLETPGNFVEELKTSLAGTFYSFCSFEPSLDSTAGVSAIARKTGEDQPVNSNNRVRMKESAVSISGEHETAGLSPNSGKVNNTTRLNGVQDGAHAKYSRTTSR